MKKAGYILGGLALVFVAISIWYARSGLLEGQDAARQAGNGAQTPKECHITVHFGDLKEDHLGQLPWTTGMTALDLLVAIAEEQNFPLTVTGSGETAFVSAIDSIVGGQDGNAWWIYTINGETANVGAGAMQLEPGDSIVWRLGQYP